MQRITTTATTTARLAILAGVSTVGFVSLGGVAAAETPVFQPGVEIANPEPQPDPEPQELDIVIPLPDPHPQPIDDIANPTEDPDPEPEPVDDLANPDPVPDPPFPGPGDITNPTECTHGCGPDPDEPIDDLANPTENPDDGDEPEGEGEGDGEGEPEVPEVEDKDPEEPAGEDDVEVLDETQENDGVDTGNRSALPRTGLGIGLLAAAGSGLVAVGAALRRKASRR